MNLVAAIQKMLPAPPRSSVERIVDAVPKPADLLKAEKELAENLQLAASLTKRQGEIAERLNVQSPIRTPLFKVDHDAVVAENIEINGKLINLRKCAGELRAHIASLLPDHARSVAIALIPFRRSAAEQLADGVNQVEQALAEIAESNRTLFALGLTPPSAFSLPYSKALKGLADKVRKESSL
jgi:hypothetical protein